MRASERIIRYFEQKKVVDQREKELDTLRTSMQNILFYPFTTYGIYTNARYIFGTMIENPDKEYYISRQLFGKGPGMYFSESTMGKHLPKIFKHFKEIKILVKRKDHYILNPIIVEYLKHGGTYD
jgi:hypothetical protein